MSNLQVTTNSFERNIAEKIGFMSLIMANNSSYMGYQIATLKLFARTPVLLDQIQIHYNQFGAPVAYLTWAKVSPRTLDKLVENEAYIPKISEWNDGEIILLMDICANQQDTFKHFYKKLKLEGFSDFKTVVSIARKGSKKGTLKIWRDQSNQLEYTK